MRNGVPLTGHTQNSLGACFYMPLSASLWKDEQIWRTSVGNGEAGAIPQCRFLLPGALPGSAAPHVMSETLPGAVPGVSLGSSKEQLLFAWKKKKKKSIRNT